MEQIYGEVILNRLKNVDSLEDVNESLAVFGKYEHYIFFESVTLLSNSKTNSGVEHIYEIETNSKKIYKCRITYYDNSRALQSIIDNKTAADYKKHNTLADDYAHLWDYLNNAGGTMCFASFYEANGNNKLTNNVGYESFEVFKGVKESLENSFLSQGGLNNLDVLIFRVDKNETKRKNLYLKMVDKYLKYFKYKFENSKLSDDYDEMVFIRNK